MEDSSMRVENLAGLLFWKKKCPEVRFVEVQRGFLSERKGQVIPFTHSNLSVQRAASATTGQKKPTVSTLMIVCPKIVCLKWGNQYESVLFKIIINTTTHFLYVLVNVSLFRCNLLSLFFKLLLQFLILLLQQVNTKLYMSWSQANHSWTHCRHCFVWKLTSNWHG